MADVLTSEQRSRCMAAIKGKDTKPEMIVRKYLFSRGLRYRLHVKKRPGSPDIVLPKYKTVIFVDGCFWHGHEGCRHYRLPKTNTDFWRTKIERNISRDIRTEAELTLLGWSVIRVWECEVRPASSRLDNLRNIYEEIVSPQQKYLYGYDHDPEDDIPLAAEPDERYGNQDS